MKRLIIIFALLLTTFVAKSQVPYFGSTAGDNQVYTYIQYKFFPGVNNQGAYVSYAYGILDNFDFVGNFNASTGFSTAAYGLKFNFLKKSWMRLGLQSWADFDIWNSFKYTDLNTGLFINGDFMDKLGYCSNTWWTIDRNNKNQFDQWTYLTYITGPVTWMGGAVTDLSDKCKTQPVLGCYFTTDKITWYLWSTNWINNADLKFVIGFDYKF